MNRTKFFMSLFWAFSVLIVQAGGVFAAPALQAFPSINGTVQIITLETDPNTGITIVIVVLEGKNQVLQTVRVSLETAIKPLGLVALDGDGNPVINDLALGKQVEIEQTAVIPAKEEDRHPVGNALATFFSDIADLDYDTIMTAYDEGVGFGVIAQALWLTMKLESNSEVFLAILDAKETGDYSAFILEDGTTPRNWGQLRKAILDGDKKDNPGIVISANNDTANGNNQDSANNKDKNTDKNKDNNGNRNRSNP
jgi:hypothetical protein